jgi:hypothetical protein
MQLPKNEKTDTWPGVGGVVVENDWQDDLVHSSAEWLTPA